MIMIGSKSWGMGLPNLNPYLFVLKQPKASNLPPDSDPHLLLTLLGFRVCGIRQPGPLKASCMLLILGLKQDERLVEVCYIMYIWIHTGPRPMEPPTITSLDRLQDLLAPAVASIGGRKAALGLL